MGVQRLQEAAASYGKTMETGTKSVAGAAESSASQGVENITTPWVTEVKGDMDTNVETDAKTDTDKDGTDEQFAGAVSNSQIKKAVEEINKKAHNSEAIFGIHDKTNRVTIKIIDKDTKKVLKEYPPEKTLDMIAKVWEVAGLLVDEKL